MRILIDADGCPVVNIALGIAVKKGIECLILCDTSHEFNRPGAETIVVSKGADSVDFAIVNMLKPGDVVITQDYGLAAMCLARGAHAISQNGMVYDENNIDALLLQRHTATKIRMAGGRLKGSPKRDKQLNKQFGFELQKLIDKDVTK